MQPRQSRPQHTGARKEKLGYDSDDPSIGDHDNQQVYIIFDYKNKLLQLDDDKILCDLFHHLDHNQIENDDEASYFMMGSRISKSISTTRMPES